MSVRHAVQQDNPFLTAPIGRLFWSNAISMAMVMAMGGFFNVVDGIFVGRLIGPEALAAVSLDFPVAMLLSALATLVGGGMSSIMARHLGAGDRAAAGRVFVGAHGLALAISVGLVVLSSLLGGVFIDTLAGGSSTVARLAWDYLRIVLLGAPVQLMLGLHADALRNEGRAGLIAALSVVVNLINIGANWIGIVVLDLGVAGSAAGTVAAQALGLGLLIAVRGRNQSLLPLSVLRVESWLVGWGKIARLGLPLCLSFIGIAVAAGVVITSLRLHAGADHDKFVAAYGVVTRLMGFAFLPQMAIALTIQRISGNNAGAGRLDRAQTALRLGLGAALLWCLGVVVVGVFATGTLAGCFSDDASVARIVPQILQPMMVLYAVSGPILVLALHLQALGQPGRTAALTLAKPWLLTPGLVLTLSTIFGVRGIWLAFPVADAMVLVFALVMWGGVLRGGYPQPITLKERP
ncbi:MAG: multi anti extrusion protein MatE [Cypionkella sp.]|nr:multi anti extrusion protein MatE [Cypionkella sp.]